MSETLREGVEALANEARDRKRAFPDHPHWSAWDHYESDLRDLLAAHPATAPTPGEVGQVEGLSEAESDSLRRELLTMWDSWAMDDDEADQIVNHVDAILAARTEATR